MKQRASFIFLAVFILVIILFVLVYSSLSTSGGATDNTAMDNSGSVDVLVSSDSIWDEILDLANNWSGDISIQGCSGIPIVENGRATGYSEGNFLNWSCNVYSASQQATRVINYSDGQTGLSDAIPISDQYAVALEIQPSFNDLTDVISSQQAYQAALAAGLDTADNYYSLHIGEAAVRKYADRYVWVVEERSRTKDEDGAHKLVASYYIDAYSGELLEVSSQ